MDLQDPGAAHRHLSLALILAPVLLVLTIEGATTSKIGRKIFAVDTENGADSFPLSLGLAFDCGLELLLALLTSPTACTVAVPLGRDGPPGVYSRNSTLHIVSSAANKSVARLSKSWRYRCRSSASTPLRGRQSGYVHLISEHGVNISTHE